MSDLQAHPYKIVSLLLQYPDEALLQATGEIEHATASLPSSRPRRAIERFLTRLRRRSLVELQEEYVATFDFNKKAGLYLSFYTYGDRRQRGMAMVSLKHRYAAAGLPLAGGELPDYLPAVLEFAALAPGNLGRHVLGEFRPAIELVRRSLKEADSPYAHLLDAVAATLPRISLAEHARVAELAASGPPTEQVGLEPFAPPAGAPAFCAPAAGVGPVSPSACATRRHEPAQVGGGVR